MQELEIKKKIKEKYKDMSDSDVDEAYKLLVENDAVPKNEKELQEFFDELDERERMIIWDDSDDVDMK